MDCWETSDMCIAQKADTTIPVVFTDANWDPINLTWSTVYLTVKKDKDKFDDTDGDAIIELDITSHTDPTAWETELILTKDKTDVSEWCYWYNLAIKDSTNKRLASSIWVFKIYLNITKR